MKKLIISFAFLTSVSCAIGPYINPGLISSIDGPITATNNIESSKTGKSCAHNILGIVSFGDNSIKTAAKLGSITKIAMADYDHFNVLGIYTRVCTNVSGD